MANTNYKGCLLFLDDFKNTSDLDLALSYSPNILLRSWYRWGEPSSQKSYQKRKKNVTKLLLRGIKLGGGTSLSIVNQLDMQSPSFNLSWLTINLEGKVIKKKNYSYATISSPGFRTYLIEKLIQQVKLGVSELHLGETAGKINFDNWTLAYFSDWIFKKYPNKSKLWWYQQFGNLGLKLISSKKISRNDIRTLKKLQKNRLFLEWGIVNNWKGINKNKEKSFLFYLYHRNLNLFIMELRHQLKLNKLSASIDVWGFADWILDLENKPDAVITTPPDGRWGFNWDKDISFDLKKNKKRIKSILKKEIEKLSPTQVVLMIDHSKPFYEFAKLPDKRQVKVLNYFSNISNELSINFVVRTYTHKKSQLGDFTKNWLRKTCEIKKNEIN